MTGQDDAMTQAEHALVSLLGECAQRYRTILMSSGEVGPYDGLTAVLQGDLREFIAHIHDLQHAVMARAAIRLYPERYRP